jgi:type III secretion protein C
MEQTQNFLSHFTLFTKLGKVTLSFLIRVALILFMSITAFSGEEDEQHNINFHNVMMGEFVRFVSKVSNVNFIYDYKELQFPVSLTSGKSMSSQNVLSALLEMLRVRGYFVMQKDGCYVIHRNELAQFENENDREPSKLLSSAAPTDAAQLPFLQGPRNASRDFIVYKLQYQLGSDVETAIKKIGQDLSARPGESQTLISAIQSVQWMKPTNSILASGTPSALVALKKLITSSEMPLKQVFIEVLVIETDMRGSLEFGLEWAAEGSWKGKVDARISNRAPRGAIGPQGFPETIGQLPLQTGFNLGVIGNKIIHKGLSYLSIGDLISALQVDGKSTIVCTQKVITQDNKNSKIFVGDNLPFTGSIVQTIGASEQTAANIEYRDVGVLLDLTPRCGDDDVITLEIKQEITAALPDAGPPNTLSSVGGIRTTKTNMSTQVHVPDQHFLVLTGMMRDHRSHRNAQIPCLGGAPLIGWLFSKKSEESEKKNIIIYVRPHIIHTLEEYKQLTQAQEAMHQ